jgi:DNA-binding XRE family transcriptional regulator
MASAPNVLGLFGPPIQKTYRSAVARCIRDIKARHSLNNIALADVLGCSDQTIANAENEENDLSGVTLMRIAYQFGEEAIAPVRALYLCATTERPTRGERIRKIIQDLSLLEKEA